ncbi:hypothetical protein JHK82_022403 [Glycine max]|nr:hypothetical protein JHK85_022886 [Glycine max]KAG5137672.1 hypothetical protein JHK82_022403 [Glycine max]
MKVYTCVSEVVLTEFMPTSTPKFKFYQGNGVQSVLFEELAFKLKMLKEQHEFNLRSSDFTESAAESAQRRITKIFSALIGDSDTCSRLTKYLASGDIMRMESLCHSSLPCDPLEGDQFDEETYCVASTEAFANLSSSISLIHLYCSRLPADGWDKETRTLYVPKSCPLQHIRVEGDKKLLKNIACLEACKQLHKIGALSDNLVPDIVIEEAKMHLDHCAQNEIATIKVCYNCSSLQSRKVLEAITTKRCEEAFHYESLETLGDSFLKYAASQQLFKTYHNHHEGLPKMCSNE